MPLTPEKKEKQRRSFFTAGPVDENPARSGHTHILLDVFKVNLDVIFAWLILLSFCGHELGGRGGLGIGELHFRLDGWRRFLLVTDGKRRNASGLVSLQCGHGLGEQGRRAV